MTDTAHYDEAWKEALDLYFEPLLKFFFPDAHREIDWARPVEFKDTEFQSLLPAADIGQRTADKLAQAFLLDGKLALILIHVEIQSQKDQDFARRMFVYHYRIYDKYQYPVMSLAILGDDNRGWKPQSFGYEYGRSRLLLEFPTVKLWDYKWEELEASQDPMSVLVMAHLKTKQTTGDPQARKRWKWEVVRLLYKRGYSRQDVVQLFRLIDWMMTLPKGLSQQFQQELVAYEEGEKMPIISSIEQMAIERGMEKGIQIGEERGKLSSVPILVELGLSVDEIAQRLNLSPDQVAQTLDPKLSNDDSA